jgi:hypothetical protein
MRYGNRTRTDHAAVAVKSSPIPPSSMRRPDAKARTVRRGNGLPHQSEIAVDQGKGAEAHRPDGKKRQCRLLASGHRTETY